MASALLDPDRERALAGALGDLLLPEALKVMLLRSADEDQVDELVVAAGPTLATVPWELLVVDRATDRRLIEVATVRGGLGAAVGGRRPLRRPGAVSVSPHAVRVIDPGPDEGSLTRRGATTPDFPRGRLYPAGVDERWLRRTSPGDELLSGDDAEPVTATRLSGALQRPDLGRMLYLGHAVSGTPEAPSAAGLILDAEDDGPYHPFLAAEWLRRPDRWPAPPRVALIGCHSDDTRFEEQVGLVQAAFHAGADVVTSTRWPLPVDDPRAHEPTATTDLALAVDEAHATSDPVAALRRWQVGQLDAWRTDTTGTASPTLWASLCTYRVRGGRHE